MAVKKIHRLLLGEARSEQEVKTVIEGFKKEADMLLSIRNSHIYSRVPWSLFMIKSSGNQLS